MGTFNISTFQLRCYDSAALAIQQAEHAEKKAFIFRAGLDCFVEKAAWDLLWRDYSLPFANGENDTRPARQLGALCLN